MLNFAVMGLLDVGLQMKYIMKFTMTLWHRPTWEKIKNINF